FALGEVKRSLLAASLEALVQHIADTFNKYAVPKLFEFNYFPGITDIPRIVPGEVETPDIKELAFLLRAGGLKVHKDLPLMNLIRRLISLAPVDQDEFEELYGQDEQAEEQVPVTDPDSDDLSYHSIADNTQTYVDK